MVVGNLLFVILLTSDIWAFYIPLFIQSSQRDSSVIYAVDQGKCSYQSKLLWHLQVCGLCAHVGLWVCAPACLRTEEGVLDYFALFLGGRFSTETGAWVWSLGWLQACFFFCNVEDPGYIWLFPRAEDLGSGPRACIAHLTPEFLLLPDTSHRLLIIVLHSS